MQHPKQSSQLPCFIVPFKRIYRRYSNQDYTASINLSLPAREELLWWQERLTQLNGKALVHQKGTIVIRSDASLQGWGAVCNSTRTLEPGRAGNAHKLFGAAGSLASAVLLEGSNSSVSTTTALQLDSCSIHQQLGGQSPYC